MAFQTFIPLQIVVISISHKTVHRPHQPHVGTALLTMTIKFSNGVSSQRNPSNHNIMPIAVIGMGCRFPGDVSDPERLWDLCFNGRTAWSKVPKDRFHQESFFHPNPDRNNCVSQSVTYMATTD